MRRAVWIVLLLGAVLLPAARGDDAPPARRPDRWELWTPRWRTLRLRDGWMLFRRPWAKDLLDPYPYMVAATSAMRREERAEQVLPASFGRYVAPESLSTPAGAREAALFFVPGRVVPDAEAAKRILDAARTLAQEAKHWPMKVRTDVDAKGWFEPGAALRLVALQPDILVRLVVVTAKVDAATGRIDLAEDVIVKGPPTIWGSDAGPGDAGEAGRVDAQMHAESARVRSTLLRALAPHRTKDGVRALAKPGVTMAGVRSALGEPDVDLGSGIHLWVYALDDGAAVVGEAGKVMYVDWVPTVPDSPFPAAGEAAKEERLYPR